MDILEKFSRLGVDNAPGQEIRQQLNELVLRGDKLPGRKVDFSHGDVDAFAPPPMALEHFIAGVHVGGKQAYTEYRGRADIRAEVATKLTAFTQARIDADSELILTSGTQGALFTAVGACMTCGDKVAIVAPDYFANRKMVEFFEGEPVPIGLDYFGASGRAGIDLDALESAFRSGVKLFVFSNPNNPTGVIYAPEEIDAIANLATRYDATLIVDELYSRQVFDNRVYTHLCARKEAPANIVTILGPSKTESMSGYRLGVAFGNARIIERMEKIQAIACLRAAGYNQAILQDWFSEPDGWLEKRIAAHQAIRDDLLRLLNRTAGVRVRPTEAGSYLFPCFPKMDITMQQFIRLARENADVTLTPGTEFGPQFINSFRINFSQDHAAAVAAIERTIALLERYRQ